MGVEPVGDLEGDVLCDRRGNVRHVPGWVGREGHCGRRRMDK